LTALFLKRNRTWQATFNDKELETEAIVRVFFPEASQLVRTASLMY